MGYIVLRIVMEEGRIITEHLRSLPKRGPVVGSLRHGTRGYTLDRIGGLSLGSLPEVGDNRRSSKAGMRHQILSQVTSVGGVSLYSSD